MPAVERPCIALRYRAALTGAYRTVLNEITARTAFETEDADHRRRWGTEPQGRRFGAAEPGFEQVQYAAGRLAGSVQSCREPRPARRRTASKISARDRPSHSPAVTASSTAAWRASTLGSRCRHGMGRRVGRRQTGRARRPSPADRGAATRQGELDRGHAGDVAMRSRNAP